MNTTSYEKGLETGQRKLVLDQLEERFGSLSEPMLRKLERWSADEVKALGKGLLRTQSFRELGLDPR
jgi:hypothetical protein